MDKIEVTQADIELRKAILKCIVDGLDRACTDGDMIEDRTDNLDRIIAAHRLATRTDATPSHWSYSDGETEFIVNKRQNPKHYPYCTETPLYTHPPATDVAALVEAAKAGLAILESVNGGITVQRGAKVVTGSNARDDLSAALAPFTKGQP